MAFLDFIHNRHAQQEQAAPAPKQRTETAREMYTRQATEQERAAVSPEHLSPEQQAKVAEIGSKLDRAMRADAPDVRASAPEPPGDGNTSQPMAQKAFNQDKTAPMLSPTTDQVGTRATEQKIEEPAKEVETQTQERTAQRAQTVARRPPSWER